MQLIDTILKAVGYFIIIFIVSMVLFAGITGEKDYKEKVVKVILIISAILALLYSSMKDYWGSDTIGSLFSRSRYDTKYYVQLFPEGSESKNYYVPADLHVERKGIVLEKVYWPNGGYTTFYDDGSDDPGEFYENRRMGFTDDEGRDWTVILSSEKVALK